MRKMWFLAMVAFLLLCHGYGRDLESVFAQIEPLVASASASPTSGEIPLTVAFTGSATGGSPPYVFVWSFGDGAIGTEQNPVHTYTSGGLFRAVLTVADSGGRSDSDSVIITVSVPPLEATAAAFATQGPVPFLVGFTGSATGGVPPYSFLWDFGDGTSSTEQNPVHLYTTAGVFRVVLTVTDATEKTDADSLLIVVTVVPLKVSASASPTEGSTPLAVSFTGEVTGGVPPYGFSWDFGDGTTSTEQNPVHTYTTAGFFRATLTVTDATGGTDGDSLTIKVQRKGGR